MNLERINRVIFTSEYSVEELSKMLKVNENILKAKINGKVEFNVEEIINLIEILNIRNPKEIFY
ncbi:DUF739 domain-containing protein [uncultured Clostridium sp.]|uniref:DUF739 domain-containing protein n=1 Tax=uncultured Clostridium sp. TaxID=59620 RepID=UPI0025DA2542|nr:DUF739 domain-containing protein [uncultured Clostridium sp.]